MANENNQNQQNQTSELVVRREKLSALVEAGNNPFVITKYDVTHSSVNAIKEYTEKEAALTEAGEELTVRVAGRMTSRRVMGKASFAHLLYYLLDRIRPQRNRKALYQFRLTFGRRWRKQA